MDALGFLRVLFPDLQPGEQINVRALAARSGRTTCNEFAESAEEALDLIEGLNPQDEIYVGVNPRHNRDGKKTGVTRVCLYHADPDWKFFGGSEQDAFDAVVGWDLEPSLVVASGNGYHCYWFLKESLPPEQIPLAEAQMRRLHFALQGHTEGVQDVSRILRVPGTWNNKDPRQRKRVRVVFDNPKNVYTPEDFERVLPALPEQGHREVTEVYDGEKPSLDFLRELLTFINPCLPQDQYYLVWAAIAYYYPDEDGMALVDEWSSEAREKNGQACSPRTDPRKHFRFKRQTGKVTTLGTLIHLAQEGGWEPPQRPLPVPIKSARKSRGLMADIRRNREDKYLQQLANLPDPGYDDLPWMVQQYYDLLGPLTDPFPRDYTTVMALTFLSNCWLNVAFQNLKPNLWVIAMAGQGSGKNAVTDVMQETISAMPSVQAGLYTSGTPEGVYRELQKGSGDGNRLFCYLGEFGDWLVSLSREHMRHARGVFCNLYDGRATAHHLAKGSVTFTNPYVTIVGTTTPQMIVETLKTQDLWGGFASRFWYLAPPYQMRTYEGRPTTAAVKELAGIFDSHVLDLAHVREAVWDRPRGVLPEYYAAFELECGVGTGEIRTFADDIDDPKMPRGRDLARVKKVATGLALADHRPMIGSNNEVIIPDRYGEMAVTLVRRTAIHRDILLAHIGASEEERALTAIQRVVDRAGTLGLSRTQILQQAHVKAPQLKDLLPMLVESGGIEDYTLDGTRVMYRSTDPTPVPPKGGLRALKAEVAD